MSAIPMCISDALINVLTFNYRAIRHVIGAELGSVLRHPQKKHLDLGCGTGSLAPLFSAKGYVGVDIGKSAITRATVRYKKYTFQQMDATHLQFPNKTFDTVLVIGVLHHLSDTAFRRASTEMARVLKPKGRALVIEAIPPLWKYNILGLLARKMDAGDYIRTPLQYKNVLKQHFSIRRSYAVAGGIFDYAAFVLENKVKR